MTSQPTPAQPPLVIGPVLRRLDQVAARIRLLGCAMGLARVVSWTVAALVALYTLDRALDLPAGARLIVLAVVAALLAREGFQRVGRPLFAGPGREDAARLVESNLPELEGRVISALQIGPGTEGSLERAVAEQAAGVCAGRDLRDVLTARPSLREGGRAVVLVAFLVGLVWALDPHLSVFARRWMMEDVAWPRRTRLTLALPERGPAHVLLEDGTLVVARGGLLEVEAGFAGADPRRVEIVVKGALETQRSPMAWSEGRYRGRIVIDAGAEELLVRGGDDPGRDTRLRLQVIDPPRLEEVSFQLDPPAYTGLEATAVGPDGLVVPEGTIVTVVGRPTGRTRSARLHLPGRNLTVPLEWDRDHSPPSLRGSFTATESDSLVVELAGEHDLAAPDPAHHALVVRRDRPPTLRVFRPARSDVKVTSRAVVPVAVAASDDHAVESVRLIPQDGEVHELQADPSRAGDYRTVLDLARSGRGPGSYRIEVLDGRQLPGQGPQSALQEGRRVDVVEDSEVQRLLAERQLRLKERYQVLRDRQLRAAEELAAMASDPPPADDPDLVAATVAQHQTGARLEREARELCGILEEMIFNRLDPGPGAEAVLEARLSHWVGRPVDEGFAPEDWRDLAASYMDGSFGRLDLVGRLLEMASLALDVAFDASPRAHELLRVAQGDPGRDTLQAARAAQVQVADGLGRLLARMDEWEDFQEVLSLVQRLLEDQKTLRARTQAVLQGAN